MNTAKLKAAAERVVDAYGDEWFEAGRQICTVHKSKICLISLSSPSNILELIAALEAAQKRNAELDERLLRYAGIATRRAEHVAELEKRIAELEARTVKLPSLNPQMFNDDVIFGYRKAQREAVEFCAAAGINLETGGEA